MLRRISFLLVVGMLLGLCGLAGAEQRVLLVNSYDPDYSWTQNITHGVKDVLAGTKANVDVFYMNARRRTDEGWKIHAGDLAKGKVIGFRPDVIIAADDAAQEYFAKSYAGTKQPVVFCGVNAEPGQYGYPAANVTGILEREKYVESLNLLQSLVPGVKRIAVIADDSTTATAMIKYMQTLSLPVEVVAYDQPSTFGQWQTFILSYQHRVDAIAILTYQSLKRHRYDVSLYPQEIMEWTNAHNDLPTVGILDFAVVDGALCGVVECGRGQGEEAAQMARQILDGTPAKDIPVTVGTEALTLLNLETANKLHVRIPCAVAQQAYVVQDTEFVPYIDLDGPIGTGPLR